MRIVEICSLQRGIIDPPESLDPEHAAYVQKLWETQDIIDQAKKNPRKDILRQDVELVFF